MVLGLIFSEPKLREECPSLTWNFSCSPISLKESSIRKYNQRSKILNEIVPSGVWGPNRRTDLKMQKFTFRPRFILKVLLKEDKWPISGRVSDLFHDFLIQSFPAWESAVFQLQFLICTDRQFTLSLASKHNFIIAITRKDSHHLLQEISDRNR